MRKVTQNAAANFNNNTNFKSSNTEVFYSESQKATYLALHGNTIATKHGDKLMISACGWLTVTTKERLNGLDGVSIYQKAGIWYLNGKEWNGELIEVNS